MSGVALFLAYVLSAAFFLCCAVALWRVFSL